MKRSAALALAVLLCWCALCQAAFALDSRDSGPVDSSRLLVRLQWSPSLYFYDSGPLFRFGKDGGMELLPRLPEAVSCRTAAGTVYQCPVRWEDPEASRPGSIYRLDGTLEPGPGYTLSDSLFSRPSILLLRLPEAAPLPVGELRTSLSVGHTGGPAPAKSGFARRRQCQIQR